MRTKIFGPVLVAILLVLAGCSGGVTSGSPTPDATSQEDGGTGSGMNPSSGTGQIAFYISDEPNAIDDFEHLNVTITKVGLHRVEGDAGNESVTSQPNAGQNASNVTITAGESDRPDADENGENGENGEWQEYEVNRTVDLTRLVGANATKLDVFDAPAGTYNKVFIYVDEINATTTNGEQVSVKLPSERLHINQEFTVGDGEEVDFVFDIAPHEAGQSGKYILKPVISESGPSDKADITDVDEREAEDDQEDEEEQEAEEEDDADEDDDREDEMDAEDEEKMELTAEFTGSVTRGEETTLLVMAGESPVSGANVTVDDELVGQTDADGEVSFTVPTSRDKLEVTVTHGEAEVELEVEFPESDDEN